MLGLMIVYTQDRGLEWDSVDGCLGSQAIGDMTPSSVAVLAHDAKGNT